MQEKTKYTRRVFYLTAHELKQMRMLYRSIYAKRAVAQFSKSKIIRIIIAAYVQNYPADKQNQILDEQLKAKLICEKLLVEKMAKVTVDIPCELVEVLYSKFNNLHIRKGLKILVKKALVDVADFYHKYIKSSLQSIH